MLQRVYETRVDELKQRLIEVQQNMQLYFTNLVVTDREREKKKNKEKLN